MTSTIYLLENAVNRTLIGNLELSPVFTFFKLQVNIPIFTSFCSLKGWLLKVAKTQNAFWLRWPFKGLGQQHSTIVSNLPSGPSCPEFDSRHIIIFSM